MLSENLNELSLDDLLILLGQRQKQLALSKLNKQGSSIINKNKNQLEKVQKAIVVKRDELSPLK